MALRIVSSRVAVANMPARICVTSSASMSSKAPAKKKRESLSSRLSHLFGGKVEAADEKQSPFDSKEVNLPHFVEQSTGEGKLFMLAFEAGIIDPFCQLPVKRQPGQGTKDNPVPVEGFFDQKLVACICEPQQSFMRYTTLYKGEAKRCACGHWMKLVQAPKFWEKLPKDDLLDIPFFRELEQQGKLDKFLAGEIDYKADTHH